MDLRLLAMIANARVQLRWTIDQNYPHLINEAMNMEIKKPALQIKRPMELVGLKSQLLRAEKQEKDIAIIAKRYNVVQDEIDDLKGAAKDHVGYLEIYKGDLQSTIERMVGGSNGDPNDDGQDGQTGQIIDSVREDQVKTDKITVTSGDVGNLDTAIKPEGQA